MENKGLHVTDDRETVKRRLQMRLGYVGDVGELAAVLGDFPICKSAKLNPAELAFISDWIIGKL